MMKDNVKTTDTILSFWCWEDEEEYNGTGKANSQRLMD